MSDRTQKGLDPARTNRRTEYRVYFTIIFILALPFAAFGWFRDLFRGDITALHSGIVGRALKEAGVITPKIFLTW
jgi:hypothetical protein